MSQKEVILLLGSNISPRKKNLLEAIDQINTRFGKVIHQTKLLLTTPVEYDSDNNYYNMAVSIETELSPIALLGEIKKIEKEMGRLRDSKDTGGYLDRPIDIDIVSYNNLEFYGEELEIPHKKHLYEREFSQQLLLELSELRGV